MHRIFFARRLQIFAISNSGHLNETLHPQERRENVRIPCLVTPTEILVPDSQLEETEFFS
jgi:hypothetical protein